MIGAILDGRYHLVRLLGEGGMGSVYEAVHAGTGRRVAVKVIASRERAADEEIAVRFQREARAAGRIETRHIVQVLDAGRDAESGLPYIAMEFLVGHDLRELVSTLGPLPPELALRIAAQACVGLDKAHHEGIVHRDIKPANLFLARQPDGEVIVKLLDFGIAKIPADLLSGEEAAMMTITGRLLGSPLFMSPEQAKGLKTLDHRTDIWSLGAVLYEALAGRPPFSELETFGQLILAICSAPPPSLQLVSPNVPDAVAAIVERAMKIEPGDRFATASEMQAGILALLAGGPDIRESDLVNELGMAMPFERPPPPPRTQKAGPGSPQQTLKSIDPGDVGSPRPASPAGARVAAPVSPARREPESSRTLPSAGSSRRGSRDAPHSWLPRDARVVAPLVGIALVGGAAVWRIRTTDAGDATVVMAPVAASSAASSAPPREIARAVQVALSPATVNAFVDGQRVETPEGAVTIVGSLGSVHRLRIEEQGREVSADVVITQTGALPATLRLEPPPIAKSTKRQGAPTEPPATPAVAATPPGAGPTPAVAATPPGAGPTPAVAATPLGAAPAPSSAPGQSGAPAPSASARPSRFSTLDKNFE